MLSGRFRSLYGNSAELFDTLQAPVIERFSEDDALESRLQHALGELISRGVCSDVMVSTDVKLVMVALLRHSFLSLSSWPRCLVALQVAECGPARQVNQYRDNIG